MSSINCFRMQIISKYQGEFCDVISHFTSKHIYGFLWKLTVYWRYRQSMLLNHFRKQINPVHTMKSYLRSILILSLNLHLLSPIFSSFHIFQPKLHIHFFIVAPCVLTTLMFLSPTNALLYYTYKVLKYTIKISHDCSYMFRSIWTIIREPMSNLAKVTVLCRYSVKIRR